MEAAEITCPRRGFRLAGLAVTGSAVGMAVTQVIAGVGGAFLVVDMLAAVAACALVPLISRRPVVAALAYAVLAAVAQTASPAANISLVVVARCRPARIAAAVAVAGFAAHALRALWRPPGGLSYGWWVVLMAVLHGGLVGWGALAAARQAVIDSLRERAERAEAEQGRRVAEARAGERARIAREMHDVLAHRLSLLATYAGALEYRPDHAPEKLSSAAGVIRASAHQALDELRDVITLLRDDPDVTDDSDGTDGVVGLERPVPALADLPRLFDECRAVGTKVEVRDELASPESVPGRTGRTAYRVLQEALTNARKHAPGQPVSIALGGGPGSQLEIEVRNPLPHEPAPAIPGAGSGLVGLTERVRLAGGRLDHQAAGDEFTLHASLPWHA